MATYFADFLTGGTATDAGGYYDASTAYDNNNATYCQNYADTATWWTKYDLGAGVIKIPAAYTIRGSIYCPSYIPTAWTFEGSNNDSDWVTLDTRTGITWASASEIKTFEFVNIEAYRYLRWTFTAPEYDYYCVAEIEAKEQDLSGNYLCSSRGRDRFHMKGVSLGQKATEDSIYSFVIAAYNRLRTVGVSLEKGVTLTAWVSPTMTAANAPSPYILTTSFCQNSTDSLNAWDRNSGSYWGTSGGGEGPQWTKLNCGPTAPWPYITQFTVLPYEGYGPRNVILQGSNDDANWDTLYEVEIPNTAGVKTYTVVPTTPYRYIRLYCTDSWTPGNQATYEITLTGFR